MTPVPGHREPDGAAMEAFEADAGMSDGDGGSDAQPLPAGIGHSDKQADPELAAAVHLKALGVPQDMGALHALTCPAYDPADVGKAFPHASFAALDLGQWQAADLDKAAFGSLDEMAGLFALGAAASTLKTADPYLVADLRAEAHKAFRDANPGPSTFPTPGELSPSRFNRPYQAEGHAAASPGHDAPRSVKLPPAGGIDAQRFTRGYLTDGRAAESPDNQHTPGPLSTPSPTGAPSDLPGRQYETSFTRNGAQHAISAMHDHISRIFPDICPMEHSLGDYSRPVPSPVGGVKPAPGAKKTAKAAKAKARKAAAAKRKAARALAQKRRSLEAKVLKGKVTVEQAREELGLKPVTKAATATEEAPPAAATVLDPEALAAAVAPLVKRLKRQDKALTAQGKALRKVRRTADAIAAQPDTSAAPFRGTALTKTSAPAVQAPTPAGYAEHAQLNRMYLLQQEVLHNPHPGQREAARAELNTLLGTSTMNPQTTIPMRQ